MYALVIRAVKGVLSVVDDKIKAYQDTIAALIVAFHQHTAVSIEKQVFRVLQGVEAIGMSSSVNEVLVKWLIVAFIGDDVKLRELKQISGAGLITDRQCLDGTRVEVIDQITHWINSTDDPRHVFFLCGQAGTGKSSIAHTIGFRFKSIGRLGAFFGFDHASPREERLTHVIRTVALNLAGWDAHFRRELVAVIREDPTLSGTPDIFLQWEKLLREPMTKLADSTCGPIVIILDALDESGDEYSRKSLLSLLAHGAANLPRNVRIIVTSRLENDVRRCILNTDASPVSHMLMDKVENTNDDILTYVYREMMHSDDYEEHLDSDQCQMLATRAEGLFQWASTVCKYLKGASQNGLLLEDRLDDIIEASSNLSDVAPLDKLYMNILNSLFPSHDERVMERFKSVVGQLLACVQPVSIETLKHFRQQAQGVRQNYRDEVDPILRVMGSLLSGIFNQTTPVRPLHTSFREFLTTPERGGRFYVYESEKHDKIALCLLRVMTGELRFNICSFPSSFLRNRDVPDLADRVKSNISPALQYACRFWAYHMSRVTVVVSDVLFDELDLFIHGFFLFWIEVQSLMGTVSTVSASIAAATRWVEDVTKVLFDSFVVTTSVTTSAYPVYCRGLKFIATLSLFYRMPNISSTSSRPSSLTQLHMCICQHCRSPLKHHTSSPYMPDDFPIYPRLWRGMLKSGLLPSKKCEVTDLRSIQLHSHQMGDASSLALGTRRSGSGMQRREMRWVSHCVVTRTGSTRLHSRQTEETLYLGQLTRQSGYGMQRRAIWWVSHCAVTEVLSRRSHSRRMGDASSLVL